MEFWGLFRGFINARLLLLVIREGGLLVVVGHGLLSSHVQRRNKKKLDILTVKITLAPRSLMSLISRKWSKHDVAPFRSLILFRDLFPFISILFSLLSSVRGLTGWKKKGGSEEDRPQGGKHWLHTASISPLSFLCSGCAVPVSACVHTSQL